MSSTGRKHQEEVSWAGKCGCYLLLSKWYFPAVWCSRNDVSKYTSTILFLELCSLDYFPCNFQDFETLILVLWQTMLCIMYVLIIMTRKSTNRCSWMWLKPNNQRNNQRNKQTNFQHVSSFFSVTSRVSLLSVSYHTSNTVSYYTPEIPKVLLPGEGCM